MNESRQAQILSEAIRLLNNQKTEDGEKVTTSVAISYEAVELPRRDAEPFKRRFGQGSGYTELSVFLSGEPPISLCVDNGLKDHRIELIKFAVSFLSDDNRKQIDELME